MADHHLPPRDGILAFQRDLMRGVELYKQGDALNEPWQKGGKRRAGASYQLLALLRLAEVELSKNGLDTLALAPTRHLIQALGGLDLRAGVDEMLKPKPLTGGAPQLRVHEIAFRAGAAVVMEMYMRALMSKQDAAQAAYKALRGKAPKGALSGKTIAKWRETIQERQDDAALRFNRMLAEIDEQMPPPMPPEAYRAKALEIAARMAPL